MKKALLIVVCLGVLAGPAWTEEKSKLESSSDRESYSIGFQIGADFRAKGFEVDRKLLFEGIEDGLAGEKGRLTRQEMMETLQELQRRMVAKQQELRKELAEKNRQAGESFLAENKKKKGVKTQSSGLQYKVIEEGQGKTPQKESTVTVHYRGTLVDGTEFDSSYERGEPATFQVNAVIPGWTEALQLMKEGAKWQIYIPADLAYGERGAGPVIGPNATLVFDVELLKVE